MKTQNFEKIIVQISDMKDMILEMWEKPSDVSEKKGILKLSRIWGEVRILRRNLESWGNSKFWVKKIELRKKKKIKFSQKKQKFW